MRASAPEHGVCASFWEPLTGCRQNGAFTGTPRFCQACLCGNLGAGGGGPQPQHPEACLGFLSHRRCLYHDCDLRVESVSHHGGQLPPSLCPEVLEAEAVPAQLLQALLLALHLRLVAIMSRVPQLLRACEARRAQAAQPGTVDILPRHHGHPPLSSWGWISFCPLSVSQSLIST